MELWDLYDARRISLRRTHVRGTPLGPGECHLVAHIWTVDSRGRLLLTLRSPEKLRYPGLWECTGGCVLAGETSRQGAVRELREETGIPAREDELRWLGTALEPPNELCCIMDYYLLRRDVPLEELILQPGETVDARWATPQDVAETVRAGRMARPIVERLVRQRGMLERVMNGGAP